MSIIPKWIPLHVHSEYSAYDGAIRVADYLKYAEENELPAAAVSDHFTMSSYPDFDKTFSASGIKPIYGNELYSGTLFADGISRVQLSGKKRFHLNSFALNSKGLINLQRLAASGFKTTEESTKGPYNITRQGLEDFHEGVVFSSACISGELPMLIGAGKEDDAKEWLSQVQGIVGKENFYIEILDINYSEQDELNKKLLAFAEKYNVKTILTTDSHYMPGDEAWYNYLLAAQKRKQGTSVSDDLNPQQRIFGVTDIMDLSLRTPAQIWEKWKDICPQAVEETVRLAERCERYSVKGDKYLMPHKDFGEVRSFAEEARYGLEVRLAEIGIMNETKREPYMDRLRHELNVVTNMGFVDYFRFVSRLVKKCREDGIYVGPGRGSAAGSVLTWSLGITNLDPLKYGLLFERFLNPERVTMPDIDIDFEDERRGDVIRKLKEDYGAENVVAITNFSRCKWKVAIRDVMRVKGYQPWQSNEFVKLLEDKIDTGFDAETDAETEDISERNVTSADLIGCIKGKAKAVSKLQIEMQDAEQILELSGHFNGIIRNYGKHASGIVICPGPAQDYMPLGRVNDVVVTQYDMKGVDYRKLVKVDILGLSTLSMIREMETSANAISPHIQSPTIRQFMTFINRFGNEPTENLENYEKQLTSISNSLTPDSINKAYEMFRSMQTTGIFQFASPGMRKLLGKILPKTMEDLSAAVALYRPGPLKSGIAEHFTRGCLAERGERRRSYNKEQEESPVDKLPEKIKAVIKEIAKDAKGEMIYQEHIMAAARTIAGYSLGEADILRKAMGKKDKALMAEERRKFTAKAITRGWTEEEASSVFDAIEYFAGYGFNKSHSFCYASLAFITAWYAANRKAVFWAALINDTAKKSSKDAAGHITLSPIIREAQECLNVYPPAMPSGEQGLSASGLEQINIAKSVYICEDEKVDWSNPNMFNVILGLSSVKGTGASSSGLAKLASLNINENDTIEDVFRKSLLSGETTALGQASQYFRNGFFDVILLNTIRKHCTESLLPVYVRLAIIEMADVVNLDHDIRDKMCIAVESLTRGKNNGSLPFKIVKSRCVWGSFISDVSTRVRNKMGYKNKPWTIEDADRWIKYYFVPVVEALIARAKNIKKLMGESSEYKVRKYLDVYRLEKNAYGESFCLPDWTVAAEMTGYSAVFYADQVYSVRREANKRLKDIAAGIRGTGDYIDMVLDKQAGVWVLGQFGTATWKGDEGGYIRLEGRFGQKNLPMYVSVKTKLPFITLDNAKKVSAMGGMMALRVYLDEHRRFCLCDSVGTKLPDDFKCGFEGLPDSIAILPLTSVCKCRLPFSLPYKGKSVVVFPDYEQREDFKQLMDDVSKSVISQDSVAVKAGTAEILRQQRCAMWNNPDAVVWTGA